MLPTTFFTTCHEKFAFSSLPAPLLKAYQFLLGNYSKETGHSVGAACLECEQTLAWDRTSLCLFRSQEDPCPLIFSPQSSHFDSHWQQHPSHVHDTVSIIRASQGSTESVEKDLLGTSGRMTPWVTANLEISLSEDSWIKLVLISLDKHKSHYK